MTLKLFPPRLSLTVKSSSHHQPPRGDFIYFIYLLPQALSISKGNILLLSKDSKPCDIFYKAAKINIWELLPLTPFKSFLLLLIHYPVIYFQSLYDFVTVPNYIFWSCTLPAWTSLIFRAHCSVGGWIFATDHMIKYGKHLVEGV